MQDFRKLRVWQKAHAIAIAIKKLTDRFPRKGYAALKRQMIRSAESVPDNIAEGCGAETNIEFGRFLGTSIRSTSELESQLVRTRGYGLIKDRECSTYVSATQTIRKMTYSLKQQVLGVVDLDGENDQPGKPPTTND